MKQIYTLGFVVFRGVNKILLMEKRKPEFQKGFLNGLGGKPEDDEGFTDCIIREIEEESGLKTNTKDWNYFCKMVGADWEVYCFISMLDHKRMEGISTKEEEKIVILDLNKINTCYPNLLGNIPWLVGMGIDSIMNKDAFIPPTIQYNTVSKAYNINKI